MNKNKQRRVEKQSMESGVQSAPSEAQCCFCIKKESGASGGAGPGSHPQQQHPELSATAAAEQDSWEPACNVLLSGQKKRPVGSLIMLCSRKNGPFFELKDKHVVMEV